MTVPLTDAEVLALLTEEERGWCLNDDGTPNLATAEAHLCRTAATERQRANEAEADADKIAADYQDLGREMHEGMSALEAALEKERAARVAAEAREAEALESTMALLEASSLLTADRAPLQSRLEKAEAEVAHLQAVVAEIRAAAANALALGGPSTWASRFVQIGALAADTGPRGLSHSAAVKERDALDEAQDSLETITCQQDCGCEGSNPACRAWQACEDAKCAIDEEWG